MTEQSDVRAAAKRLIAEAAIAEREMLHMYSHGHRPDYLTVATYALEAVNDRARLLGEVEALKAELHGYHVTEALRWSKTAPEMEDCTRCAALDAAPAGAQGASDAGDGDGER